MTAAEPKPLPFPAPRPEALARLLAALDAAGEAPVVLRGPSESGRTQLVALLSQTRRVQRIGAEEVLRVARHGAPRAWGPGLADEGPEVLAFDDADAWLGHVPEVVEQALATGARVLLVVTADAPAPAGAEVRLEAPDPEARGAILAAWAARLARDHQVEVTGEALQAADALGSLVDAVDLLDEAAARVRLDARLGEAQRPVDAAAIQRLGRLRLDEVDDDRAAPEASASLGPGSAGLALVLAALLGAAPPTARGQPLVAPDDAARTSALAPLPDSAYLEGPPASVTDPAPPPPRALPPARGGGWEAFRPEDSRGDAAGAASARPRASLGPRQATRRSAASAPGRLPVGAGPAPQGSALSRLARARLEAGDTTQALEAARDAFALMKDKTGPDAAASALELARAYAAAGEDDLAHRAASQARALDPEGPLVDDALYLQASLAARALPNPARMLEGIHRFLRQDPLTLDEDAMIYFLGFSSGLRLDRVHGALEALEAVWTEVPEGDKVADARLHAAIIRGLALDQLEAADQLLATLASETPHSARLGLAALTRAFLRLRQGQLHEALAAVGDIQPEDARSREGAMLGAMIAGYYLGDGEGALRRLAMLRRAPGRFQGLAAYHQALLLLARRRDPEAAAAALEEARAEPEVPESWVDGLSGSLQRIRAAQDLGERDLRFARFFERIGHAPRAREEYRRLLEAHPEGPLADRARLRLAALDQDDRQQLGGHVQPLTQVVAAGRLPPAAAAEARWRLARGRLALGAAPSQAFAGGVDREDPFAVPALRGLLLHSSDSSPERIRLLRELADELDASDPSRPRVLAALGAAHEAAGQVAPALAVYQELLPDRPAVAQDIHRLMDRRRVAALSPDGEDPEDPSDQLRLALFHLRLGEGERAEALLEGARKGSRPDDGPAKARARARAGAYLARLLHLRQARPDRVREVLDDAVSRPELPDRDRLALLELRATRLARRDEGLEEARDLHRALVRRGYKQRQLLPLLVEHAREEDGPRAALGLLRHLGGQLEPDARLTALVAELYDELDEPDRALDARARLVQRWPEAREAGAARRALADAEAQRLRRAFSGPLPPARRTQALAGFLARVGDAELKVNRLVLDELAERAEELSPASARLLGPVFLRVLGDPARAQRVLQVAAAAPGAEGAEALLELARSRVEAGDLRGAYGMLEPLSRSGFASVRGPALFEMARLQDREFGDAERGAELAAQAVAQDWQDPAGLAAAARLRVDLLGRSGATAQVLAQALEESLARVRSRQARRDLRTRLARTYEELDRLEDAGREWLAASQLLEVAEDRLDAARRGLQALYRAGRFAQVSRSATEVLARDGKQPGAAEIRALLRKASARTTVDALLSTVDWADPEAATNRTRLWQAAELLVNPLEEFRKAAARLQDLVQLFPGSAEARKARALLTKMPLLEGAAEARAPDSEAVTEPADRLAAARFVEYRLEDPSRAADAYRQLYQEDRGMVSVLAGLALLRILTFQPGAYEQAWDLADQLRGQGLPPAVMGRMRARLAALEARERWARLEARSRRKGADGDAARAEMARLAAGTFQDGPLALGALSGMSDRAARARAAIQAAGLLDPSATPAPEAAGARELLDLAIQVAPDPALRAEAHLARARYRRSRGEPRGALADLGTAARLVPGSAPSEEALFQRASLLLLGGQGQDEALRDLNTLVDRHPGGPRYLVASTKAAALKDQLEAARLDARAAREGPRDAELYFHTARLLAERYDALKESLENYRTYIRVGQDAARQATAHQEAAAVLVRMGKPEEAVLMLERLLGAPGRAGGVDMADVHLAIGRVHEFERAALDRAAEAYREALRLGGGVGKTAREAREGLERIQGLRADDRAAESSLGSGEEPSELAAIRAEYLSGRRKDWRAAAKALRARADSARDDGVKAKLLLALARIEDRQLASPRDAARTYERYLEISRRGKDEAAALLRAAELFSDELNDPGAAHDLYARFLKAYHSDRRRIDALFKNATVLERLDRVQEAIQIYQNIIDSYPRSGSDEKALERLAYLKRTYFAAFQEAIDAYRELIARFPFSGLADDAQYNIGRVFEVELGDLVQAKGAYETLLQRYPTSEFYARAQQGLARIARR